MNINSASTLDLTPLVVATQTLDNSGSSADQSMSFSFSKTVSSSNTFSHTSGRTVDASVSVKASFADIVENEVTLSVQKTEEWTYGGSNTRTYSFEATNSINVPAGKIY